MSSTRSSSSLLLFLAFLGLSSYFQLANCWGTLGHRTIAYLAQKYFTDDTATYVNDLLANEDIADASLWADEIKRTPVGAGTSGWHFIDAKDDPPRTCKVKYNRDCDVDQGCVVSAIINMTARINDNSLPRAQNIAALKFLLHFIGDVHQPLHTESEDRGGNEIPVLFRRKHTNLHAIWDTDIPDKMRGGHEKDETEQATDWANELFNGGAIDAPCTDITTPQDCALVWAGEANAQVCAYVLKDDVEGVEGRNLAEDYYEGAVPVVNELIGKAGFRLGAWLNALAAQNAAMKAATEL